MQRLRSNLLGTIPASAAPAALFFIFLTSVLPASAQETLNDLERLVAADPKPFVIVEASGKDSFSRGQGVVVTKQGHVLSAAHISWDKINSRFADTFRISFRGAGEGLPKGVVHLHKTTFADTEGRVFLEHYYQADLKTDQGSRFIGGRDLAVFKIKGEGNFPVIDFYSKTKPEVRVGDVFHLCHFSFPHGPADPTFLINPVEVVGVAQTTRGIQYLARGYYRIGSSGGALLKDGRLIGIQSAAYTVNTNDIGEVPMGLVSFQLVWRDQVESLLK